MRNLPIVAAVGLLLLACSLTLPSAGTAVPTASDTHTPKPAATAAATRRAATPTVRKTTQLATHAASQTPRPSATAGPSGLEPKFCNELSPACC